MSQKLEHISTKKLIELALKQEEEEIKYLSALQFRGTKDVLNAAQELCKSINENEKELGIYILGQLGIPQRTFPNECLEILLNLLKRESNTNILGAIGIALGHLGDRRAIQPLVKFKNHPDADVRYGVVSGLLCQEDELAIDTLIELSQDEDSDIRNWATFGLGTQIDTDSLEVKKALWRRIQEESKATPIGHEIYGEALVGLAKRNEKKVIELILQEITSDSVSILCLEAAELISSHQLYPALFELKQLWKKEKDRYFLTHLEDAIQSCKKI
ncbi:conserved hypothetical protein [Hyella patelloides LEGE 07179]|uniref:PBS lyase HEAT domain protein repeat-containing protein n=1 Tax=Hyella patelloides LEGE 07179 TaxID=945734 RepID=A0A563VXN2_9CYAN|nr:HEAT repeat domain-containing protein [Hyella patelloides]VEP16033.1 conserved hypothetical protein [Hyella patelloides LEGE 07179]